MRGISEERLKVLKKKYPCRINDAIFDYLLEECHELQEPWMTLDDTTPKDKVVWLFTEGHKYLGSWETGGDGVGFWSTIPFGTRILPTHWQEIPDDPVIPIHKPEPPKCA